MYHIHGGQSFKSIIKPCCGEVTPHDLWNGIAKVTPGENRIRPGSAKPNTVAWEAPLLAPKICYHAQSRYVPRSVPAWELQAPENWFSLTTLLQVISLEVDPDCVLTVRKIHKLGLGSAAILREHFGGFGEVERVMLLPSRPKSCGASLPAGTVKVRPASMAFVVMRSRQPAIIARLHEVHNIDGHQIQVQKFRKEREEVEPDFPSILDDYSWLESSSTDFTPPLAKVRKNSYAARIIN
jgi:hypothetical protein